MRKSRVVIVEYKELLSISTCDSDESAIAIAKSIMTDSFGFLFRDAASFIVESENQNEL